MTCWTLLDSELGFVISDAKFPDLKFYLSALATSKAWSRVNAAREIVAAGVSGEW
jgi:hypothetical protein